jgi:23S rRNA (cytosine1962-C5)-methyltransferase
VLNLFGYTGGATLAAARSGADVTHVDGSKTVITIAKENADLSGLSDKTIRWMLDDVLVFVRREIKRGKKYDGIIMDPPAFGHGVDKELWKIEEHLLPLVENCMKLLKDKPLFFLINGYSAGYSSLAYRNMLVDLQKKYGGNIEIGELAIEEESGGKAKIGDGPALRLLPAGIFARWRVL